MKFPKRSWPSLAGLLLATALVLAEPLADPVPAQGAIKTGAQAPVFPPHKIYAVTPTEAQEFAASVAVAPRSPRALKQTKKMGLEQYQRISTLPQLERLIRLKNPRLYRRMRQVPARNRVLFLKEALGGTTGKLLFGVGGLVAFKAILDRVTQAMEEKRLLETAAARRRVLVQSRIRKRNEISSLESTMVGLEQKLDELTSGTGSLVAELSGWVDSHRF